MKEPRYWIIRARDGNHYGPFSDTEAALEFAEKKWPNAPEKWDIELLWPPEL